VESAPVNVISGPDLLLRPSRATFVRLQGRHMSETSPFDGKRTIGSAAFEHDLI
jgi:hypothetical protein